MTDTTEPKATPASTIAAFALAVAVGLPLAARGETACCNEIWS